MLRIGEIMRGNGILQEYDRVRFVTDAEAIYSYEETKENNLLIIGWSITGLMLLYFSSVYQSFIFSRLSKSIHKLIREKIVAIGSAKESIIMVFNTIPIITVKIIIPHRALVLEKTESNLAIISTKPTSGISHFIVMKERLKYFFVLQ